jgi:hypothetical protein
MILTSKSDFMIRCVSNSNFLVFLHPKNVFLTGDPVQKMDFHFVHYFMSSNYNKIDSTVVIFPRKL